MRPLFARHHLFWILGVPSCPGATGKVASKVSIKEKVMHLLWSSVPRHYLWGNLWGSHGVLKLTLLLSALVGLQFWLSSPLQAATLPPGFTDSLVREVVRPTDAAWTPDGRIILLQQMGQVHIITPAGQSV